MIRSLAAAAVALALPLAAHAFPAKDLGGKTCADCHKLTPAEAEKVLKGLVDKVLAVRVSDVSGLWDVDVEKQGHKIPAYLHFSKKYVVAGNVIRLDTSEDLTREREIGLNRIDASVIPLDDAVVIGNPKAAHKIVVFDDPECPFCVKIHAEMKKVVAERKDIAFFIKMLPLDSHPTARKKAEAIICAKSLQLLDDSLAGKAIPEPTCQTDQVDQNKALAAQLGIRSTPTLVFADGRVVPGYRPADKIIETLERGAPAPKKGAK